MTNNLLTRALKFTSGTQGQVPYLDVNKRLALSVGLSFDSTNERLGVGLSGSPSETIHSAGNVLISGTTELALMILHEGAMGGNVNITNSKFQIGRQVEGGVANKAVLRILHSKDGQLERSVCEIEETGTIASVSDGTRRSHF